MTRRNRRGVRKPASTRGVTRDPASVQALARDCAHELRSRYSESTLEPDLERVAVIACLRDRHHCTLEQIGEALEISGERVRQLYRAAAKEASERTMSGDRAPVPSCDGEGPVKER